MAFEPHQVHKESLVYRGLGSTGWIDRQRNPWGVKLSAFIRKKKDDDGLTVMLDAHLCCALKIIQIAKLQVAAIESIVNPTSGGMLVVWCDQPDHAYIDGLPFHEDDPQTANDLATDLANLAEILSADEYEAAKKEWGRQRA